MTESHRHPRCILALEDGSVFIGRGFGATGTRTGEVVFNTAMMGYQEILTDPSYCGQIVTMTYPLIGNYGVNREDVESTRPHIRGFVIRELARHHSNHRATTSLEAYLGAHDIIGIEGIDTRALTKTLRVEGAMRGVLTTELAEPEACVQLAREAPGMIGADFVKDVSPRDAFDWEGGLHGDFIATRSAGRGASTGAPSKCVVAVDCGMKHNILRHLVDTGCEVHVVPPTTKPEVVLERKPDGVFFSNGPGDPAAVGYGIDLAKGLIGRVPIFGICLGHQILGLALGAKSFKLKFGHRGGNQPVQNITTGRVEITSQNHGFAVDRSSLESAGATPTHINLNDHTLEGFVHKENPLLAVQYHPEASPGPHDATYLFDCFHAMMTARRSPTGEQMAAAQAALQNRTA